MKAFTGIWATFDSLDYLLASIDALKEKDIRPAIIHAPFNISGKVKLDHTAKPELSHFALTGSVLGAVGSFYLIWKMSVEWIQPLSAKPIVSILTMIPIAFEVTILLAVVFILIGILALGRNITRRTPTPKSEEYRNYTRFTKDRFGLVLACEEAEISDLKMLLNHHQAEEVFVEK